MRTFVFNFVIAVVAIVGSRGEAAVYSQMDPFLPYSPNRDIATSGPSPLVIPASGSRLSSFFDLGAIPPDFSSQSADVFSLPTNMVAARLSWMGGYFGTTPGSTPTFRVGIYTGSPFSATTTVFENTSASVSQTAVSYPSVSNFFLYGFDLPSVSLTAGTNYWLSIAANFPAGSQSEWGWAFKNEGLTSVGNNQGAYREVTATSYDVWNTNADFAFRLEPIPEPSMLVIALSFAGTAIARGRMRRRAEKCRSRA